MIRLVSKALLSDSRVDASVKLEVVVTFELYTEVRLAVAFPFALDGT